MGFAANVADRVVFLDQGKIIEQGMPEQVFKNPESTRLRQFLDTWKSREL
jgi:polar amino acid transport system ATP-binding protein